MEGYKIRWLDLFRRVGPSSNEATCNCECQPIMLEDRILGTEQSLIRQLTESSDCSTFALTERPDSIYWLVFSNPTISLIVLAVFFKIAFVTNKYPTLIYPELLLYKKLIKLIFFESKNNCILDNQNGFKWVFFHSQILQHYITNQNKKKTFNQFYFLFLMGYLMPKPFY